MGTLTKSNMPAPVPETVLKKRKATRSAIFKKAEKYVKEYRSTERSATRMRRMAKATGNLYVEPEAKLAFVIRIRGINGMDPKSRKIMNLLRLRQIHNGIFMKINKATFNNLRRVEPYVAYGYPSLKTVKELIYKRGYAKVKGSRVPLTDNSIIEENLGKYGIICMEDLIHEIYTVGPHFKECNAFLWPTKLSCPRGGFANIRNHFM